ncbi:hypothetical protein, partial [Aeromonas sp. QDB33]|uniref:hypothetical protein n=1 Tax=Aeromonas sp. QDB33 TaxID=2990488 RepID=UPI0022E7201F
IYQPPKGDQEMIVTFDCQRGAGERLHETNYNKGREVLDLLFKGQPYPTLPEQKACKGQRVLLNTMLTRTFNLKGLPAIWRVDGLAQAGTPPDLLAFLNERRPSDDAEK